MVQWNAVQYLKFQNERTQPAQDLAQRIREAHPEKVLDVGCGPGNSTRVLADVFPGADILGIDASPTMIKAAGTNHPDLTFKLCDAGKELPKLGRDFDIVFSNACLQWVPNHPKLLPELLGLLNPGGILAVQIPMNQDEPIHKIIQELATSDSWREAFPHPRVFYTLPPGRYVDLLAEIAADFTVWQTTYFHRLRSHQDILEWYRGTGLRPYLDALPDARKPAFEEAVLSRVVAAYPLQKNGEVIFRFPRFFFIAMARTDGADHAA
mgnify:CR=1 FL=1